MSTAGTHRWLLVVAVVALGEALQQGNGALWAQAIEWLTVSFVAVLLALVFPRMPASVDRAFAGLASVTAVAGFAFFFARLLTAPPAIYLRASAADQSTVPEVLATAAVLCGVIVAGERRARIFGALGVTAAFTVLAVWTMRHSPAPRIDVWNFQMEALDALSRGVSPYGITTRNIYSAFESERFYGPGISVNGQLQVGYPYMPLTLLLTYVARALTHDLRAAQLAAMIAAGLALAFVGRRARWGAIAAGLLLFTPRIFFVIEQSWTEPILVGLFSLVVLVAVRVPRWVWLPLGLFIAAKQYGVLVAPLALLLLPRPLSARDVWTLAWRSALVAIVLTAPFALWDPDGFLRSAILFQFRQPFRADALSYLAWMNQHGWTPPSLVVAFAATIAIIALSLWRAPRSPFGFALASSAAMFVFVCLNKQAFANYYFLIAGMLCTAIAASDDVLDPLEPGRKRSAMPR